MNKFTASKSIHLTVPAARVWAALTTAALIKEYLFGTEMITDWKQGSPIIFRGEWEGKPYQDKGIIMETVPNKIFRYSYWSSFSGTEDKPENYAVVTYHLFPDQKGTLLSITQDGIASAEAQQHSESNWESILNTLKKLVEQ
ncbi:MAG: SRPBCC domain-containing protein [Cyclobacteriaceae bacterium]|jgi:uncharacterized protein YndB with AHSA1/START domain|nr:SRPBCC domain-containing protein [Cyclobacteriaceae bacterium]